MDKKEAIDTMRVMMLGRNGYITNRMKGLGKLSVQDKKAAHLSVNTDKEALQEALGVLRGC